MSKENKGFPSQEKIAAANYVLNFYQEVATLTSFYSQYENILLELKAKFGEEQIVPNEEREYINEVCKNIRYYVRVCYIKHRSIVSKVNKGLDEEIETLKNDIATSLIIDRVKLEKFVFKMNDVLINNVIKDLLQNSSDIINSIFSENERSN